MNEFSRFNKVTGVYWLKKAVENIKIRIKFKPKDGVLSLPKFEDYTNDSRDNDIQYNNTQEYAFKWQEKVFSVWELQRYIDVHNCITDSELAYHNMISESMYEPSKVFTYIHDDGYLPLPNRNIKKQDALINFDLNFCMQKLRLNERIGRLFRESNSMAHLFRSEDDVGVEKEQWTAMHVVLDNSEYNEDSQLLLKQEATLLSLYHNANHNYIILSPDVNNFELNPYSVETATGMSLDFQYAVEVDLQEKGNSEELVTLLKKLCKKWDKKHKNLVNFTMPPLGKRHFCVTLEIVAGTNFDMDDLYVEYHIQIPETIQCDGVLHGRTHRSSALVTDDLEQWCFGYTIELGLEMDIDLDPPPLQIFFEVISTDWWGRHRTEGYSYLPLTLDLGRYERRLSCSRPEETDKVEADNRRFFVGGCHLIKDLEVLAKPQLQDANFTYVNSGVITLQWDVISQTPLPGVSTPQPSTSSASALLLGAEAVLRQYRKARAKLAAATKDFTEIKQDGSDDG